MDAQAAYGRYLQILANRKLPASPWALWQGEIDKNAIVVLWDEQGLGDAIQYVRYAPMVRERVECVVLCCNPRLLTLLSGFPGVDRLAIPGERIEADFMCPLPRLPVVFQTRLEEIPADVPYLFARPGLVEPWLSKLPSGFRIGIAWQGDRNYHCDAYRSIPLAAFAPLARCGVQLISLQKGHGVEQIAGAGFSVIELPGLDESNRAFIDTAAVMKSLDLVITCDTAIGHLAGALGVPVWVALAAGCDCRWLDRDDSPWYPTMRLFRQQQLGEWGSVFQRMAVELAKQ